MMEEKNIDIEVIQESNQFIIPEDRLIYTICFDPEKECCLNGKNCMQFIFVFNGCVTFEINHQQHVTSGGTVICINSHSDFNILQSSGDAMVYCVYIKTSFFKSEIRERISHYPIFFYFINYCSKSKNHPCSYLVFKNVSSTTVMLFELLHSLNLHPNEDCTNEYIVSLIAFLTTQIQDLSIFRDAPYVSDEKSEDNILEILNYIYTNYQKISLAELAEHFHYSPNYLSNLIHQNTRMTYGQHLTQKRLKVARYLLETSNHSINYIIKYVGYTDKSSFYRQFLKEYNHTPSQIRKKYKESQKIYDEKR